MEPPKTHDEMTARIIDVMKLHFQVKITEDDEKWLKGVFDGGCECSLIEEELEREKCKTQLFEGLGLPLTEEDMANMNEEQSRKFMLLSPLANMAGGCPEH